MRSPLKDLRGLVVPPAEEYTTGVVVELLPLGRVMVSTNRKTLTCTTLVPLLVGAKVRVQGLLVVSKYFTDKELPVYQV